MQTFKSKAGAFLHPSKANSQGMSKWFSNHVDVNGTWYARLCWENRYGHAKADLCQKTNFSWKRGCFPCQCYKPWCHAVITEAIWGCALPYGPKKLFIKVKKKKKQFSNTKRFKSLFCSFLKKKIPNPENVNNMAPLWPNMHFLYLVSVASGGTALTHPQIHDWRLNYLVMQRGGDGHLLLRLLYGLKTWSYVKKKKKNLLAL